MKKEYRAKATKEEGLSAAVTKAVVDLSNTPSSISLKTLVNVIAGNSKRYRNPCEVKTTPPSSNIDNRYSTKSTDLMADNNDENDLMAAIAITELSQRPAFGDSCYSTKYSQALDSTTVHLNRNESVSSGRREQSEAVDFAFKGHSFKITRKWIGHLECYQLESPDDIPNTKILRCISSEYLSEELVQLQHSFVNATHLRMAAVAVLGDGIFDKDEEESQHGGTVIELKDGPMEARGVWVPLERARELVEDFEIESSPGLAKLLGDNPLHDQLPFCDKSIAATPCDESMFVQFDEDEKTVTTSSTPSSTESLTHVERTTAEILSYMSAEALGDSQTIEALSTYIHCMTSLELQKPTLSPISSEIPLLKTFMQHIGVRLGSVDPSAPHLLPNDPGLPIKVHPLLPSKPYMYITVIDNLAVCVAAFTTCTEESNIMNEHRIMRRLDNSFVNGTQLLTAGGIDTESERSMILSLEIDRVRMPSKESQLFGTWIPRRRAQELAITCSIQNILGPFLDDDIECLFPSPLPSVVINARKRNKTSVSNSSNTGVSLLDNHQLAALTLAALKDPILLEERDYGSNTLSNIEQVLLKNSNQSLDNRKHMHTAEIHSVANSRPMVGDISIASSPVTEFSHSSEESIVDDEDSQVQEDSSDDGDIDIVDNNDEDTWEETYRLENMAMAIPQSSKQLTTMKKRQYRPLVPKHQVTSSIRGKRPSEVHSSSITCKLKAKNHTKKKRQRVPDAHSKKAIKSKKPKKRKDHTHMNTIITHTLVNEDDEDAEIDIGGSDGDDDLR